MRILHRTEDGHVGIGEVAGDPYTVFDGQFWMELTPEQEAALPPKRLQSAWRLDDEGELSVDLAAAQEAQRDKWRAARGPLMAEIDVTQKRAIVTALLSGSTAELATLEARLQALRDVTTTPMDGLSVEQVDQLWPACLGERPSNL